MADTDPTDTIEDEPQTDTARLAALQGENEALRVRVAESEQADTDRADKTQEIEQQSEANGKIRRELAQKALTEGIREAAEALDIDPGAAGLFKSNFRAEVDASGEVHITPNPTEFFAHKSKTDSLLERNQTRNRETARIHRGGAAILAQLTAGQISPHDLTTEELIAADALMERKPDLRHKLIMEGPESSSSAVVSTLARRARAKR